MGQRLVICIKDSEHKNIATAYYHWGGYTISAIELSRIVINDIDKGINYVKALQNTGAKLQGEIGRDRNKGLIDTDEKEMENAIRVSEQLITINLDSSSKIKYIELYKLFDTDSRIEDFQKFKGLTELEVERITIRDYEYSQHSKATNKLFDKIIGIINFKHDFFFLNGAYYEFIL